MRTIIRLIRTAAEAWGYLGLTLDAPPPGRWFRPRIGPRLAWELARIRHPTPAEEAESLAKTREAIAWVRAMHARIDGAEATEKETS